MMINTKEFCSQCAHCNSSKRYPLRNWDAHKVKNAFGNRERSTVIQGWGGFGLKFYEGGIRLKLNGQPPLFMFDKEWQDVVKLLNDEIKRREVMEAI